jgi:formate dehydrogenase subunit gamma
MGISFVVLGITGLIILFGKFVLLPVIGYTLFSWLSALSKNLHNFVAPLFAVSLLIFIIMFIKDNLPKSYDFSWFAKAPGFFAGKHIPSGRFNGGEKVWFWAGVVVLCLALVGSGAVLLFPNFDQVRSTMQQMSVIHMVAALLVIAAAIGHIYMGTIGVEGAYRAMRDGSVDETWAKEHHEYWYNDVKGGARSAPGGAVPAGAPRMREKQ